MFLYGLAAAIVAAVLFNVGIALQAIEARRTPKKLSLKAGMLTFLLRRKLWLLGAALGIVGIGPQLVALSNAPFAVVQTALTGGLVVLLFIAMRYLNERLDLFSLSGIGLLIGGVALVSWGAPGHSDTHRSAFGPILVVGAMTVVAALPFVVRRLTAKHGFVLALASGVGFAGANVATKLASDNVGLRHWPQAAGWSVMLVALGVCATITSMSAIQDTAAAVVVPVSTAVQTFLPIVLEPLFVEEHYTSFSTQLLPVAAGTALATFGVVLIGRDPAVAELASGGQS